MATYRDRYKAQDATYRAENRVDILRQKKEYNAQHAVRRAEYRLQTREHRNALSGDYRRNNLEKYAAHAAKRRAAKRMAIPAWADLSKIRELYELAALLSVIENATYQIDHIVPLQSDIVCGLHCEANLQIILESENKSKGNRRWPDMPE